MIVWQCRICYPKGAVAAQTSTHTHTLTCTLIFVFVCTCPGNGLAINQSCFGHQSTTKGAAKITLRCAALHWPNLNADAKWTSTKHTHTHTHSRTVRHENQQPRRQFAAIILCSPFASYFVFCFCRVFFFTNFMSRPRTLLFAKFYSVVSREI